jgi:hypothetical protein
MISQVLTGQPATTPPSQPPVEMSEPADSRRAKMRRWGFITIWSSIVLAAFFGITGGAIEEFAPGVGEVVASLAGLGGLILLIGLGLMFYSFLLPKATSYHQPPQPTALPQARATASLPHPSRPESVSSVTEHTTELLETSDPQAPVRQATRQKE